MILWFATNGKTWEVYKNVTGLSSWRRHWIKSNNANFSSNHEWAVSPTFTKIVNACVPLFQKCRQAIYYMHDSTLILLCQVSSELSLALLEKMIVEYFISKKLYKPNVLRFWVIRGVQLTFMVGYFLKISHSYNMRYLSNGRIKGERRKAGKKLMWWQKKVSMIN
jgi:hypothetical protein